MRIASEEDFEGGVLYDPPYHDAPFFWQRADEIRRRYNGKILVAGCGWGFMVRYLLDMGMDAWGCDASQYAVDRAAAILSPDVSARVLLTDVTQRGQMNTLRSSAGLQGNRSFQVSITEDLLTVLDDAEISTALVELRRASNTVFHIVTASKPDVPRDLERRVAGLNWKSHAEWKAVVSPDLVLDAETGEIL